MRLGIRSAIAISAILSFVAEARPGAAQVRVPGEGGAQSDIMLLRKEGGPVVPFFEGWQHNADGSYELVFGYFNVNTAQAIDIPLGENNRVEPLAYDGGQPTHFQPILPGERRHLSVFTVNVPADFGIGEVIWTLRNGGQSYSVPGRITSPAYELEGTSQLGRLNVAPRVQLEENGPISEGVKGIIAPPLRATVGRPVRLPAWVTRPNTYGDMTPVKVRWAKHQGPGEVTFNPPLIEVEIDGSERPRSVPVEAVFSTPGEYTLRLLALNDIRDFEFFCCWTNAFLKVTVAP